MRLLKYLALFGVLLFLPVAVSHAQVSVGIGVGGPVYGGYGYEAPVCSYGYYDYAPYTCAPYGYYGPSWFNGGIFIGAGPWFRGGYGYRGARLWAIVVVMAFVVVMAIAAATVAAIGVDMVAVIVAATVVVITAAKASMATLLAAASTAVVVADSMVAAVVASMVVAVVMVVVVDIAKSLNLRWNGAAVVPRATAAFVCIAYTAGMTFELRVANEADCSSIALLIALSVRGLQWEYSEAQREAALRTVFTLDSQLVADGTYFVAMAGDELVGCGGWSYRKTLYGGDGQVDRIDKAVLDPAREAAKIRAIFVHPAFARRGVGGLLLKRAEDYAAEAGFCRVEMGSTLSGVNLYEQRGYKQDGMVEVPVADGITIRVVRMSKVL